VLAPTAVSLAGCREGGCADRPGFVDAAGYGCEVYTYASLCEGAAAYAVGGVSAAQACLGLYRIITSQYRTTTSYQVSYHV
jgi:hypothetical protein